jgi:hypothetical protein
VQFVVAAQKEEFEGRYLSCSHTERAITAIAIRGDTSERRFVSPSSSPAFHHFQEVVRRGFLLAPTALNRPFLAGLLDWIRIRLVYS